MEPTSTDLLTPQKLAAFYRAVGGNHDELFLSTPSNSLSLIYRSLGCFHSLQPTSNAFESPSIPALLPNGFVRWQTMQLLLGPDEHIRYFQEALKKFEIINPLTGATFPRSIPREAFPEKADEDVCKWHKMISRRLEQDFNTRRIKAASPLYSPRGERTSGHEGHGAEGSDYFPRSPNHLQHKHRPVPPSRSSSHDQRKTSHSSTRRRSLPDQTSSSWPPGTEPSVHFANDSIPQKPKSPLDASLGHRLSTSSGNSQSRHRTSNASSHHRPSSGSTQSRPSLSLSTEPAPPIIHPAHRNERSSRDSRHRRHAPGSAGTRVRPRSPTLTLSSSGSAASSEDSLGPRASQSRGRRRDSLFPPNALTNGVKKGLHHLRRHSHDATYRFSKDNSGSETRPPLPPRPNVRRAYELDRERPPPSVYGPQHALPDPRISNQVKFHESIFQDPGDRPGPNNGPDSPTTKVPRKPRFRYTDSQGRETYPGGPGHRKSSESENDKVRQRLGHYENIGGPTRSKTMTGVQGRRYPGTDPGSGSRFTE